jgi:carboxyl-terminal processing protease
MPRFSITKAIIIAFVLLVVPNATLAFSDVDQKNPRYSAIEYLFEKGIVKGYEDGSFRPDQYVSRAEFYKMAFENAGYKPPQWLYKTFFHDVPKDSWFAPYVENALNMGLIQYNPDYLFFMPANQVSHIEAIRIILPIQGIPTPLTSNIEASSFKDIDKNYTYHYLINAAQKSGIYLKNQNGYFIPNKPLTRGETAELIYKASQYKWANDLPIIEIELNNPIIDSDNTLINNTKFPIMVNVWNKINEQYLNIGTISQDELVYGAINGMVNALSDPYSKFENPKTAQDLQNSLDGTYEGIGTVLDSFNGQFIIIAVFEGSPAQTAGVKPGDIITKIDDTDLSSFTIEQVLDLIKGRAGTTVKLTIKRDTQVMNFSITRKKITMDTVLLQANTVEIPSDIGYIAIYQFTNGTIGTFKNILESTMKENPKGLILDLRDNPGGYVQSAYDVIGMFIPSGETIAKIQSSSSIYEAKSTGSGKYSDTPIIILVNEHTASAAEIVAGALQQKTGAKLVGKRTYGKGTVQEVNVYTDGSMLKLSVAKWLTPNNYSVDKVGLKPDHEVLETLDDVLGTTDTQLQKAISLL